MPRVSEIASPDGHPLLEAAFAADRDAYGDVLNPTRVMAHCPEILRAAKQLSASIAQSARVPPGVLALVYTRVATINGCPF